ncbi:hypothetical protein, partial [Sulfurimonas sp.]
MLTKYIYLLFSIFFIFGCASNTQYRTKEIIAELDKPAQSPVKKQAVQVVATPETDKQREIQTKEQDQEITTQINNLIIKKDFEGLKQLTEKDPNLVNYIQDEELRLMLTGPKGMKVGDIRKLL